MRFVSQLISTIFHPIFLVVYMFIVYQVVNPYLFITSDKKAAVLIMASVISLSVVFPLLCIIMMKMLGLIDSFEMKSKKERVGPLIATSLFYLWLYINVRNNDLVPEIFSYYLLGAVIALFIAFFINNFSKISLHCIGIGAMAAALIFVKFAFGYNDFIVQINPSKSYLVNTDILIMAGIVAVGLIGSSRLYLNAHKTDQVYGGFLVGAFSHVLAYIITF